MRSIKKEYRSSTLLLTGDYWLSIIGDRLKLARILYDTNEGLVFDIIRLNQKIQQLINWAEKFINAN